MIRVVNARNAGGRRQPLSRAEIERLEADRQARVATRNQANRERLEAMWQDEARRAAVMATLRDKRRTRRDG